jgi:hypothetical protein
MKYPAYLIGIPGFSKSHIGPQNYWVDIFFTFNDFNLTN